MVYLRSFCSPTDRLKLVDVKETRRETALTLAAAHALVRLEDGTTVGDPMEKIALDALNWQLSKGTSCIASSRDVAKRNAQGTLCRTGILMLYTVALLPFVDASNSLPL